VKESPAANERRVRAGAERSEDRGSRGNADPLRILARERGRILGELGATPEDGRWARAEADAIASLVRPRFGVRLPPLLASLLRRLRRALR
jgi:hypothetical protein